MSASVRHSQHTHDRSDSGASDIRDAKALSTYRAPNRAPPQRDREPIVPQEGGSRHPGTHPDARNLYQSQDDYKHSKGPSRKHDTISDTAQNQPVAGPSRQNNIHLSQMLDQTNPQYSHPASHQRHPTLSLDTRNLPNPRPSPFTPSRTSENSPSLNPLDPASSLLADLTSLKSGLESLWNVSSKKLHVLHSTVSGQAETIRSVSLANSRLESAMTQQQAELSKELERLGGENNRLMLEVRDADESRKKALREREMLGDANARLWEDKARLEGEKRELRVKLDAETEFAKLCRLELEKMAAESQSQGVKVKMEEDEGQHPNAGLEEIRIPLVHVEEIIKKRLQCQADEFTRATDELYTRLAQSQTYVTELQAQLKRYSNNAYTGKVTPPMPSPHLNRRMSETKPEEAHHAISPVTPHTANPSSVSDNDREHQSVRPWSSRKAPGPNFHGRLSKRQAECRPGPSVSTREGHAIQRAVAGPTEYDSTETGARPRRLSVPSQSTHMQPASQSQSNSPNTESIRLSKRVAPDFERSEDGQGQVASTYTGVRAGWKPTPQPNARTSQSEASSRPPTPDRPFKKARTDELQDAKPQSPRGDVKMTTSTTECTPTSPVVIQPPTDGQLGGDMTADEHLMFTSLSRVLVKKRDNDGWKCVLCRQEKKPSTMTFSETTPIGVVTHHVKEMHKQFWKDLNGGGNQAAPQGR